MQRITSFFTPGMSTIAFLQGVKPFQLVIQGVLATQQHANLFISVMRLQDIAAEQLKGEPFW